MKKKILIVGHSGAGRSNLSAAITKTLKDDVELIHLNEMPSLSKDIDKFEEWINERGISSDPCLSLLDRTRNCDLHEYGEPSAEEKRRSRAMEEIHTHLSNNSRTWREEYELIKLRKSKLSRYCRGIIVEHFENRNDEK